MNPLVIIPARSGSKGLPQKNIKLLNGKPMIQYTIEVARSVFRDKDICVSTDDLRIIELAENLGLKVPFVRPSELASDHSSTEEVIRHALGYYEKEGNEVDTIILLQATSPLRTSKHLQEAIKLYLSHNEIDMIFSVKETASNPYYVLFEENSNGFLEKSKKGSFTRRQDCPKVWEVNGAIYIINAKSFRKKSISAFDKIMKYQMDDISSIDIDNQLDFDIVELILKKSS